MMSVSIVRLLAAGGRLDRDDERAVFFLHADDLGRKLELHPLPGEDALELLAHLAVETRRDAVEEFDDRDFAAEPAPHRTELKTDIAAADHEQAPGHRLQRERAGRRDDLLFVDRHAGNHGDFGSRGDDDVLGVEGADAAVLALHFDLAGRGDARFADNRFGLVLLEQEFDALGQFADDLVLVCHHGREIETDLRLDAELGEILARFLEQLAGVQKRLGGDAADIQAGAAKGAAPVDAGAFQAELAQPDRRIVPARSTADYDNVKAVCHESLPELR